MDEWMDRSHEICYLYSYDIFSLQRIIKIFVKLFKFSYMCLSLSLSFSFLYLPSLCLRLPVSLSLFLYLKLLTNSLCYQKSTIHTVVGPPPLRWTLYDISTPCYRVQSHTCRWVWMESDFVFRRFVTNSIYLT